MKGMRDHVLLMKDHPLKLLPERHSIDRKIKLSFTVSCYSKEEEKKGDHTKAADKRP